MGQAFDDRDGWAYVDGKIVPHRKALIHTLSNSAQYGGSIFEGERSFKLHEGGKAIFLSDAHSERLLESARLIHMDTSHVVINDEPENLSINIIGDGKSLLAEANNLEEAYFRVHLYKDAEEMGVGGNAKTHISIFAWQDWNGQGDYLGTKSQVLLTSPYSRQQPGSVPVQAKVDGNYVIGGMAKAQAKSRGGDDGLILDYEGNVADISGGNIFCVSKEGVLHMPHAHRFEGLTSKIIRAIAVDFNLTVNDKEPVTLREIKDMKEVFTVGTAVGVVPVGRIDETNYKAREFSALLREKYEDVVRSDPKVGIALLDAFNARDANGYSQVLPAVAKAVNEIQMG
ncbi:MAG: aminotransferase class IV [Alphaproteobacteria bacterium]